MDESSLSIEASKCQCPLEILVINIRSDFDNSPKGPGDIDSAFERLILAIHEVSKTLPHTRSRKNIKPFWDRNLNLLKYNKVESYRSWVADGRPREPDNVLYQKYKSDKKIFHRYIKNVSKKYENDEILEAVRTAELDHNTFWKMISKARRSQIKGVSAIRRSEEKAVHELHEVLNVWVDHFTKIGKPKEADYFDERFFDTVTEFIRSYNEYG